MYFAVGVFAALATLVALLLSFACPFIFMKIMVPRKGSKWNTDVLDLAVSAAAGMGLVHWIVRMVSFTRTLNETMGLRAPVDGAVTVIGIITTYIVDWTLAYRYKLLFPDDELLHLDKDQSKQKKAQRSVIWNAGYTYMVRPLGSLPYIKLVVLSGVYSAVEGFNAGIFLFMGGRRLLCSAVVHQMLMTLVLSVSGLRTHYTAPKLIVTCCFLASAMPLGMLAGTAVGDMNMNKSNYAVMDTVASMSSGAYGVVLFGCFVLPEVKGRGKGRRTQTFGWGALTYAILTYPAFDM